MAERQPSVALDDIYHMRALNFYMRDGGRISSRAANWQEVRLEDVIMLELEIRGKKYRIARAGLPSSFVEFVHFRSMAYKMVANESGVAVPEVAHSWTIGWSDGFMEHLVEMCYHTGKVLRVYDDKINLKRRSHFHPHSIVAARGTLR